MADLATIWLLEEEDIFLNGAELIIQLRWQRRTRESAEKEDKVLKGMVAK